MACALSDVMSMSDIQYNSNSNNNNNNNNNNNDDDDDDNDDKIIDHQQVEHLSG